MLPARHVLHSRLFVKASHGIRSVLHRYRPNLAHQNKPQPRRSFIEGVDRLASPGHASQRHLSTGLLSYRTIPFRYDQRSQLLDGKSFIPWLVQRLELLIRKSENDPVYQRQEDKDFATFLRNLIPVLKSDSTWRALSDVQRSPRGAKWQPTEQSKPLSLFKTLKEAFAANGEAGVDAQLKYSYRGFVAGRTLSKVDFDDQAQLADLRYPIEWYPTTRETQRTIHLHVGPTNSGKTYHALKRLEQATTGLYAGPLRLLAHEVYTRLITQGKTCDLITGDEQRYADPTHGPCMKSCTVEMVPLNANVDVAVIDEIQMIGDSERGWAWTQALLGLKAKEIHLCGEERTVPLLRELAASMGDQLEIHTYKRLSPLETMSTSLQGNLNNLRKGDCLVVFSRVGIHAMKTQIERNTGKRVAIVYGSLPPEVRAQQAALFNDPNNDYDILVASDAIGMGLNLAIKRIVFETVTKFNGSYLATIEPSQIRQIAGRAGRYRTANQAQIPMKPDANKENPTAEALLDLPAPPSNLGLVTTLEEKELPTVRSAMQIDAEPIMTAGLIPPTYILEKFARYFPPSVSFSYILLRLHELSRLHPRYHLCQLHDQVGIADVIQPVEGLTIHDRTIFCAAPAHVNDPRMPVVLAAFARCVGEHSSGELLSIPEVPLEVLDEEVRLDREYMRRLESLHKTLVLYLWLSYRFAGVFVDQDMAFHVKKLTEEKIDAVLVDFSASPAVRKQIQAMKQKALRQVQNLSEVGLDTEDPLRQFDPQVDQCSPASVEEKSAYNEDHGEKFGIPRVDALAENEVGLVVEKTVSRG